MNDAEAKAEEHWKWLESWLHKMFVDAFVHGWKHGGATVEKDNFETVEITLEKPE